MKNKIKLGIKISITIAIMLLILIPFMRNMYADDDIGIIVGGTYVRHMDELGYYLKNDETFKKAFIEADPSTLVWQKINITPEKNSEKISGINYGLGIYYSNT